MNRYNMQPKIFCPEMKPGQLWLNRHLSSEGYYVDNILRSPHMQSIVFYPSSHQPEGRWWDYESRLSEACVLLRDQSFTSKTEYSGTHKPQSAKDCNYIEPIFDAWIGTEDFSRYICEKTGIDRNVFGWQDKLKQYLVSCCIHE